MTDLVIAFDENDRVNGRPVLQRMPATTKAIECDRNNPFNLPVVVAKLEQAHEDLRERRNIPAAA